MELVKVFNFSDKKPGFLEIIEVCLNLGIGFCITWLALLNYKKANFKLTTRATLNVRDYISIVLAIFFVCICLFPLKEFLLSEIWCQRSALRFWSTMWTLQRCLCQFPSSPFLNLSYFTSKDETPVQHWTRKKMVWYVTPLKDG